MNRTWIVIVTTAMLAVWPAPASAQLLGGLLGGGGGDGGGGIVGGVVGAVTGGGDSGGGGIVDTGGGGVSVSVPGVADVGVSTNGGTIVSGSLLGGGGNNIGVPLNGVLGGNSGAGLELPGLNGLLGLPGTPGSNGNPGQNGLPGINGVGGSNGLAGISGLNGRGATGLAGRDGLTGVSSSRLRTLLRILENRAWLRFAQGNRLCLPTFGVANVASWVRPNEYGDLQRLLAAYGQDIATLQQMMKRCRNGQQRMVDIGSVIGVDLRADGQIVVMTI